MTGAPLGVGRASAQRAAAAGAAIVVVDEDATAVFVTAGADTGMGSIVAPAYGVPVGVEPQSIRPAGVGGKELRPPESTVAFVAIAGSPICILPAIGLSGIDIMDCVDM